VFDLTHNLDKTSRLATIVLWVQGTYFLATGLWPLLSIETFQMVTGQKTDHLGTERGDHWLVITIGVLVIAISASLLLAAWQRILYPQTIVLAIGSLIGLTAIDVIYVYRGAIPPIYLLDAGIELMLLGCWAVALAGSRLVASQEAEWISSAAKASAGDSGVVSRAAKS